MRSLLLRTLCFQDGQQIGWGSMDSAEKVSKAPAKRSLVPKELRNQMTYQERGVSGSTCVWLLGPPLPTHSASAFDKTEEGAGKPLFVPIWEIVRERFLQLSKEKPEGKKIIGVSGEGSEGRGYRQYILIWIDSVSVLSVSETNYLKIIRVLSLKAFCLLLIPWFIFI